MHIFLGDRLPRVEDTINYPIRIVDGYVYNTAACKLVSMVVTRYLICGQDPQEPRRTGTIGSLIQECNQLLYCGYMCVIQCDAPIPLRSVFSPDGCAFVTSSQTRKYSEEGQDLHIIYYIGTQYYYYVVHCIINNIHKNL